MEKGSLSSVRESLSSALENQLDETQKQALRRAFEQTGIKDDYESAGESLNEAEILTQAAQKGDLDDVYGQVYDRDPDLREALSSAASGAFDQSSREAIAGLASDRSLDVAYKHCSRGNVEKAAEAIGASTSNFNPSSANECRNMVANMTGYAETLFNAFQDSDSTAVHVENEYES